MVGAQRHQGSGCGHQASFQLEFIEASRMVHLKDRGWTLLPLPVGEDGLGGINSPLLGASWEQWRWGAPKMYKEF